MIERVLVEHRALESCIRTHVLADLLTHVAGIAVSGEAVEQTPEQCPAANVQRRGYRRPVHEPA